MVRTPQGKKAALKEIKLPEDIASEFHEYYEIERASEYIYKKLIADFGLRVDHGSIFYYLWTRPTLNQTDIVKLTELPKQTVHSCVKVMQKNGWIDLVPSEEDRRVKEIHLTEKGMEVSEEAINSLLEIEANTFARMTKKDRRALIDSTRTYHNIFLEEAIKFTENK